MKVFIEQSGEENVKSIFTKGTRLLLKNIFTNLSYPYPYGFIEKTLAPDGDNLDCYIITDQKIKPGCIVECITIGMVEWTEDGKEDNKIFMIFPGENFSISNEVKQKITYFAEHFFDHIQGKIYTLGKFLSKKEANAYIEKCKI